jgi:hypothetical protein
MPIGIIHSTLNMHFVNFIARNQSEVKSFTESAKINEELVRYRTYDEFLYDRYYSSIRPRD